MEYTNKILEEVESHHLCYMHEVNKQSYAMSMIAFGGETFKSAKHVEDLDLLKSLLADKLSIQAKEEMPNFVLETIIDWIKIIICFENFMKASLLINGYVIHKIDINDKYLSHLKNQSKHPLKLEELLLNYNFSLCIEKRIPMLEGITPQTISMSTMLSKKYQDVIKLPDNIYTTIKRLNIERNNLHFYHEAKNIYSQKYFEEMDYLIDFVDNIMMNLFGHLMKNVHEIKRKHTDNKR